MSLARAGVLAVLSQVKSGRIELRETRSGRHARLGDPWAPLRAGLDVHTEAFYSALARKRSIGLAESYADGLWDSDDLVDLLRIGARNIPRLDAIRRHASLLTRPVHSALMRPLRNHRRGARRNVAAHYDLGNELFAAFLDRESMMYSSALYDHPGQPLEHAQRAKVERICEWLELGPEDHLLEIGTGWGGLAAHAARTRGCRVTTTTLSAKQREHAAARIRAEGIGNLVEVIGADYRDLRGSFTKLASIEMIEAVGWQYFDLFFRRCSELLNPGGLMFLQAICIDDRAYEAEKAAPSFANTLVFPGGCLPSLGVIDDCVRLETDMHTESLEDISASYVLTLREWRRRFDSAAPKLDALGYDRRFRRLWRFYLAFSEAGFREERIRDVQILLAKPARVGSASARTRRTRYVEVGQRVERTATVPEAFAGALENV